MAQHKKFAGFGQHEFYMPTTGRGHKNRRDRKKCEFYYESTGYCTKIRNQCVGPTVCMKYRGKKNVNTSPAPKKRGVGSVVYSKNRGQGQIVTISGDICTVEFVRGGKGTFKYPDAFKNGWLSTKPPEE